MLSPSCISLGNEADTRVILLTCCYSLSIGYKILAKAIAAQGLGSSLVIVDFLENNFFSGNL